VTTARERNPDRAAAKAHADATGRFWLACPRCGEYFSGSEWLAGANDVRCLRSPTVGHGTCCPKTSAQNDVDACRRSHEMHGEGPEEGWAP
jgi:hypothetical protein